MKDILTEQLVWTKPPNHILIIKKQCTTIFESFAEIIKYLIDHHTLVIYVEEAEYNRKEFQNCVSSIGDEQRIQKFTKKISLADSCSNDETNKQIDLIICLGGDGTLLHASTLFQQKCPPVLSIHMGSLGFLCPFGIENYKEYLNGVLKGNLPLLLRNRLKCQLEKLVTDDCAASSSSQENENQAFEKANDTTKKELCYELLSLNEIVVCRGPSSFVTYLDLYVNEYLITSVQGDGLIISTPTGSTAYAMAAGASMSHPSLPAITITPICPHSLSFRPIVVPANINLRVRLGADARHTAWFSVDGRTNEELKPGYELSITTSEYPLPSICRSDQINDWFEALASCLDWNKRLKQLPLNSCYLRNKLDDDETTK